MKTNLDAIKYMDEKQLAWLLNCVFFSGVNSKVFQLCNDQGVDVPEISIPKCFDEFYSDNNTDNDADNIVKNPFNAKWLLEEAEESLTDFSSEGKIPMPLGLILLQMIKITPEEYEKTISEMDSENNVS